MMVRHDRKEMLRAFLKLMMPDTLLDEKEKNR